MSLQLTSSNSSFINYPISGLLSSSNSFTLMFWAKRTSNAGALSRHLLMLRTTPEADGGHDMFINPIQNQSTGLPSEVHVNVNYNNTNRIVAGQSVTNAWTFYVLAGSNNNLYLKYWDGTSLLTSSGAQTSFVPHVLRIGGNWSLDRDFIGRLSHLRIWSVGLSDSDINAERLSDVRVRTANSVGSYQMGGGTLATALVGQNGPNLEDMGDLEYSSDAPSFTTFTGAVITGTALLPTASEASDTNARVNRLLSSNDLRNATYWTHTSTVILSSVAAPFGVSHRFTQSGSTQGIAQLVQGHPNGSCTFSIFVRRVDADFVTLTYTDSTYANGLTMLFNLVTATVDSLTGYGTIGVSNGGGVDAYPDGWYRLRITFDATFSARAVVIWPSVASGSNSGKSIDISAPQIEDEIWFYLYKPTTTAIVTRVLSSIRVELAIDTIGVNQTTAVSAQLLDDTGAPWDGDGPVVFASSDLAKVSLPNPQQPKFSDKAGWATEIATGVAIGASIISASHTGYVLPITTKVLTVGAVSIVYWIRIIVEKNYRSTTGWYVGVWRKHATQRFPTDKLFEVANQQFLDILADESTMDVAVPAGVVLQEGEIVECVIENDNLDGRAQDGPGIFPGVVVTA